jgi:glucosamine-6-phosphate deaminase
MTIDVLESGDAVSRRVQDAVSTAMTRSPRLTLGLPTGRTPLGLYAGLSAAGLDWSGVRTFNLDEFEGLAPQAPGSFRAFMDAHLFRHVNLRAEAIGFLRGDAADAVAECARYEAALVAAGGLDLLILGLGGNGHIGFNEPAPQLVAETHVVTLEEATRRANANAEAFGGDWRRVPPRALTMGMRQVLGARRVILMATGAAKADAVAAMVDGPLTTACPASWLQVHADVQIVLDPAAAARLGRG